jgi:glycosyltransferase involved in cell wall biosynthesis
VPAHLVHNQHGWEVARQVASRVGASPLVLDRLWLRTVMRLDATCARLIAEQRFQAFVGLEHASLMTLRAASLTGKPTVLVCASPHHSARRRWVDSEFAAFPALKNRTTDALLERQRVADDRRDQELRLAEVVLTNSRLTTQSIVDAGVPGEKIVTLPLGIVPALNSVDERPLGDGVIRFVFAGTVAPHKGIHYLLEAWARLRAGRAAELHVFGKSLVSAKMLGIHSGVTMHGAVPYANLRRAYLGASVFVLPTLYDGYGEVIGEALAHGVPVVTTSRAGAADLIRDGVNGFIVPPADARALADRMDWCLRHPREIEAMRPRALETARQWTWEAYRRALREVLAARLAA